MKLFQADTWDDNKFWIGHYIDVPNFQELPISELVGYLMAVPLKKDARDRSTVLGWLRGMGAKECHNVYLWLVTRGRRNG